MRATTVHANIPALGPHAMMVVAVCDDQRECLVRFLEQSLELVPPAKPEPEVEALAA